MKKTLAIFLAMIMMISMLSGITLVSAEEATTVGQIDDRFSAALGLSMGNVNGSLAVYYSAATDAGIANAKLYSQSVLSSRPADKLHRVSIDISGLTAYMENVAYISDAGIAGAKVAAEAYLTAIKANASVPSIEAFEIYFPGLFDKDAVGSIRATPIKTRYGATVYNTIVNDARYATEIRPLLVERNFPFYTGSDNSELYSIATNSTASTIWDEVSQLRLSKYVYEIFYEALQETYPDAMVNCLPTITVGEGEKIVAGLNEIVTIDAGEAPAGMKLDKWVLADGSAAVTVADANSAVTTVKTLGMYWDATAGSFMFPAGNVVINPTWKSMYTVTQIDDNAFSAALGLSLGKVNGNWAVYHGSASDAGIANAKTYAQSVLSSRPADKLHRISLTVAALAAEDAVYLTDADVAAAKAAVDTYFAAIKANAGVPFIAGVDINFDSMFGTSSGSSMRAAYLAYWHYGKGATDIYQRIVADERYATEIRPLLVERGFHFMSWGEGSTKTELSAITDAEWNGYGITSAQRDANRSIWDAAMAQRLAQYMEEIVYEPLQKYYPGAMVNVCPTILTAEGVTVDSVVAMGETVTIDAGAAPEGKEFDKWIVVDGSAAVTVADENSPVTTIKMLDIYYDSAWKIPAGNIAIIPSWKVAEGCAHDWADATCTDPKTCTLCGETEGEALGHTRDEGVVTKKPTLNEAGEMTYTCTACGAPETEEIPALDGAVAEVNDYKYATLADAVANAPAGATITMLKNANGAGFVIDKALTIDFGGFTYTVKTPVGSTGTVSNAIQILKSAGEVTLKHGRVQIYALNAADFYIMIQNYADLTIDGMILIGTYLDKYALDDGDSYVVSNNSGNVTITNTTINVNNDGALNYAVDACKFKNYDAPTVTIGEGAKIYGKIEVTGGNVKFLANFTRGLVFTSGTVTKANGAAVAIPAGYCWSAEGVLGVHDVAEVEKVEATTTQAGYIKYECACCGQTRTETLNKLVAFARIGDVTYGSVAAALEAANPGDEIVLLRGVTEAGLFISKDVTINFAGYIFTVSSSAKGTSAAFVIDGADVTLCGGRLQVSSAAASSCDTLILNNGDLNLEGMTLIGSNLDKNIGTTNVSYVIYNAGIYSADAGTKAGRNNDGGALAYKVYNA